MKKLIILVFCSIPVFVSAQIKEIGRESLDDLVFYVNTNTTKYDDAEGTRYLNDQFVPAKINNIKSTKFVRFNVVENSIEIKDDDKIASLSKSHRYVIKLLDGSDKIYETFSYLDDESKNLTTFFEKINEASKYTLYLKERIIYTPPKKAKSSYDQDIPGKFKNGHSLFYVTDFFNKSNKLIEIPRKKKNLRNLFKSSSKSIEQYIKKEKIKLDKKEGIIKLLSYYFEQQE